MNKKYFLLFLEGKTTIVRELNWLADSLREKPDDQRTPRAVAALIDEEMVEALRSFGEEADVGEMFSINGELIVVRLAEREYRLTEVRW